MQYSNRFRGDTDENLSCENHDTEGNSHMHDQNRRILQNKYFLQNTKKKEPPQFPLTPYKDPHISL